jgi:hypothetical protein
MWQPGSVGGLILMRPPTAWEERIPRREELYEAARFHTVQIGIVKERIGISNEKFERTLPRF